MSSSAKKRLTTCSLRRKKKSSRGTGTFKKRLQRIRSDLQARNTNRLPRFSACNRLSQRKRRKTRNRHEGLLSLGRKCRSKNGAWLGSLGTEYFGEQSYPRPAAVIMQYTGLGEVYGNEPPTYNCVGTNDGIASFKTMERRINAIKAKVTDAQIEVFRGLGHGFGLGQGTVAEG